MNCKWKYLSYLMHPEAPAYGGSQAFFDEPDKQMDKGDSCNTRIWRMSNHMGTHIDFPRHFSIKGKVLNDYPADFWFFNRIDIIFTYPVEPGKILSTKDLNLNTVPADVELLLIKTGFCDLREDPVYWQSNPGLHPELATSLRKNFPRLKVIGFDFISLSSFVHRELGRNAHKAFLDTSNPILLLEDMDMNEINESVKILQAVIAPLRVKYSDAAPCTVLAEVEI